MLIKYVKRWGKNWGQRSNMVSKDICWAPCTSQWPTYMGWSVSFPQLARKYSSISATSMSSETIFSLAGNIVTKKRCRLASDSVGILLFLHTHRKQWIIGMYHFAWPCMTLVYISQMNSVWTWLTQGRWILYDTGLHKTVAFCMALAYISQMNFGCFWLI